MFNKLKQLGDLKKMRDQAVQMQKELAGQTIEVYENGVKIVMTGDQQINVLEVDGASSERVVNVLNKAIKQSQELAARKLAEMSGGLQGLMK